MYHEQVTAKHRAAQRLVKCAAQISISIFAINQETLEIPHLLNKLEMRQQIVQEFDNHLPPFFIQRRQRDRSKHVLHRSSWRSTDTLSDQPVTEVSWDKQVSYCLQVRPKGSPPLHLLVQVLARIV